MGDHARGLAVARYVLAIAVGGVAFAVVVLALVAVAVVLG